MKIEHAGNTLRVIGVKELDAATATTFQDLVRETLTERIRQIEVDLSSTANLDSFGLGALVGLRNLFGGGRGTIRLINPAPPVQQMLDLTRLYSLLEVVKPGQIAVPPDVMDTPPYDNHDAPGGESMQLVPARAT